MCEFGQYAPVRSPAQRLTHADNMQRIRDAGHTVSPLFGVPYFHTGLIAIDWLHCMDLGVSQVFLGSLFDLCMSKFPGNAHAKCNELWQRMQAYYERTGVENQFQTLKPTMLQGKRGPKLRGKAGETRSLIGFGMELAESMLTAGDEELAARAAAVQLANCYSQLSRERFRPADMQVACDMFSAQYIALRKHQERQGGTRWPVKPKFHLMQELMYEALSSPADAWTYRDEGWGGVMAKWSFRRGGKYSPKAMALSLFQRFGAQKLPEFQ